MTTSRTQQQRRAAARHRYAGRPSSGAPPTERRRAIVRLDRLVVGGVVGRPGRLAAGVGSDDDEPAAADPTPTPSRTASPAAPVAAARAGPGHRTSPPLTTIATRSGDIVVELATRPRRPEASELARLPRVRDGFYDGTSCHRLDRPPALLYVLQCGDPTGTGAAGPGYTVPDENLPEDGHDNYPAGTVAMAEPRGRSTHGSQFFLVYRDTTLPPDYTVLGTITSGLDVLRASRPWGYTAAGPTVCRQHRSASTST